MICKPKNEGGLGFRRMFDANQALIMKLGWGLIYKPGTLWVRVLRGKYECGEGLIPLVRKKNRESLVWQGIRKTWEPLSKGLAWRLGDGNVMRFWSDRWLMSGHILKDVGVLEVPLEILDLPVSHFLKKGEDGSFFFFLTIFLARTLTKFLAQQLLSLLRAVIEFFGLRIRLASFLQIQRAESLLRVRSKSRAIQSGRRCGV